MQARSLKRGSASIPDLPALIFMTDRHRVPDPLAVAADLPRGSGVILRDYDARDRASLARDISAVCRRRGLLFLVAGDYRLAHAVGADGVHLPEWQVRRRAMVRPGYGWVTTAAAHGLAALVGAGRSGVDAALLSPAFATRSHPGASALGPVRLARLVRKSPCAVYALGGIDCRTAARLQRSGVCGVAAIGAVAEAGPLSDRPPGVV